MIPNSLATGSGRGAMNQPIIVRAGAARNAGDSLTAVQLFRGNGLIRRSGLCTW